MPHAPKRYSPLGIRGATTPRDHTYTSHQRGYTKDWSRAALAFVLEQMEIDPRCRICLKIPPPPKGRRRPYDVDHRIPPSSAGPPGSPAYIALFWDRNNWQLACVKCNASKQNRVVQ